jgi:hypothetical protein
MLAHQMDTYLNLRLDLGLELDNSGISGVLLFTSFLQAMHDSQSLGDVMYTSNKIIQSSRLRGERVLRNDRQLLDRLALAHSIPDRTPVKTVPQYTSSRGRQRESQSRKQG